eukprot:5584786-Prymnesium_polylepis.1
MATCFASSVLVTSAADFFSRFAASSSAAVTSARALRTCGGRQLDRRREMAQTAEGDCRRLSATQLERRRAQQLKRLSATTQTAERNNSNG